MNEPNITASFRITIGRETRWVECYSYPWHNGERFYTNEPVALARVGRTGSKLWPSKVTVWRQKDGSYKAGMNTVHLNRQAVIVAWADAARDKDLSQHNSAYPRPKFDCARCGAKNCTTRPNQLCDSCAVKVATA